MIISNLLREGGRGVETGSHAGHFFIFSEEKTDISESVPPAARQARCGWKVRQETAPIRCPMKPPPSWYLIVDRN